MNALGRFIYMIIRHVVQLVPIRGNERVRVVIVSGNSILMVKSWLSQQNWALPGGGISKGEPVLDAAVREVKEETGVAISQSELRYVTSVYNPNIKAKLRVYACHIQSTELPDLSWRYKIEIIDRHWYALSDLPSDVSAYTKNAITLALEREN